jgi:hypothetical protein
MIGAPKLSFRLKDLAAGSGAGVADSKPAAIFLYGDSLQRLEAALNLLPCKPVVAAPFFSVLPPQPDVRLDIIPPSILISNKVITA